MGDAFSMCCCAYSGPWWEFLAFPRVQTGPDRLVPTTYGLFNGASAYRDDAGSYGGLLAFSSLAGGPLVGYEHAWVLLSSSSTAPDAQGKIVTTSVYGRLTVAGLVTQELVLVSQPQSLFQDRTLADATSHAKHLVLEGVGARGGFNVWQPQAGFTQNDPRAFDSGGVLYLLAPDGIAVRYGTGAGASETWAVGCHEGLGAKWAIGSDPQPLETRWVVSIANALESADPSVAPIGNSPGRTRFYPGLPVGHPITMANPHYDAAEAWPRVSASQVHQIVLGTQQDYPLAAPAGRPRGRFGAAVLGLHYHTPNLTVTRSEVLVSTSSLGPAYDVYKNEYRRTCSQTRKLVIGRLKPNPVKGDYFEEVCVLATDTASQTDQLVASLADWEDGFDAFKPKRTRAKASFYEQVQDFSSGTPLPTVQQWRANRNASRGMALLETGRARRWVVGNSQQLVEIINPGTGINYFPAADVSALQAWANARMDEPEYAPVSSTQPSANWPPPFEDWPAGASLELAEQDTITAFGSQNDFRWYHDPTADPIAAIEVVNEGTAAFVVAWTEVSFRGTRTFGNAHYWQRYRIEVYDESGALLHWCYTIPNSNGPTYWVPRAAHGEYLYLVTNPPELGTPPATSSRYVVWRPRDGKFYVPTWSGVATPYVDVGSPRSTTVVDVWAPTTIHPHQPWTVQNDAQADLLQWAVQEPA